MKILITGVPGTGKTTVGNYFAENKHFFHQDMEKDEFEPARRLRADVSGFLKELAPHEDIVITWGFSSFFQRDLIELLRSHGFILFWLDGDRIASFRAYMHREKHDDKEEYEYYGQLQEIIATGIIERLQPIVINPFAPEGTFREVSGVVEEILRRMDEGQPQ
jgi:adenylate kinase family enzyme